MGFSVNSFNPISTILADIALLPTEEGEVVEETAVQEQGELLEPQKSGSPRGTFTVEGRLYFFMQAEGAPRAEKLATDLLKSQTPKEKETRGKSKEGAPTVRHFSEKTCKPLPSSPPLSEAKEKTTSQPKEFEKANATALPRLSNSSHGAHTSKTHERAPAQSKAHAEAEEGSRQTAASKNQKERLHQKTESSRPAAKERAREESPSSLRQKECALHEPVRCSKEEEPDGFAEYERENQDQRGGDEDQEGKSKKIDEAFEQELVQYANQESRISGFFGRPISHFDLLLIFIEILKLEIKGREQERISRMQERELQLFHMQEVVENYKGQGKWVFRSSLGAGIFAIISGALPVVGHLAGDQIIGGLSKYFTSLEGKKQKVLFESWTKITSALSDMQKSTGQIHQTYAEGERTFHQNMSELYRSDWEEGTRSIEDIKDQWKGIENFLYQAMQMEHDTIRQLYSH